MVEKDEEDRYIEGKVWVTFTVILPALFLAIAYVVARFIADARDPAAEIYGTGDLLPLAALILLSVLADVVLKKLSREQISKMFGHLLAFIVAILVFVAFYGAIKVKGIQLLRENEPSATARALEFAALSWAGLLYAAIHGCWVRLKRFA